ncbi:MAG TPA: glutamine-hydrolyzing carbamoyl-phosphate synthase small subunit [Actinomycetota bacterium]|nr:glutamine-hydrolyzing carbamoyl-phosphate synthase small subunit [Actinomycetota bacterium]
MSFTIPMLDEPDSDTGDPALVVLEDGTSLRGEAFGARGSVFGEAVFATGMTGYQETLTDPSYHRQVIVMTAPHVGNTGMNREDPESGRIWAAGFVVRDLSPVASNWRAEATLATELAAGGVVGVRGVDTRALTRHLRERGAMRVGLFSGEALTDAASMLDQVKQSPGMLGADLSAEVTTPEPYTVPAEGAERLRVVAVDLGIKRMTPALLARRGITVEVVPATYSYEQIRALSPDGLFLSNGPGDPATADHAVGLVQAALADRLPTFGICFGNQILGRALGFGTYKLTYGHRGINQPVQDRTTGKVEITAHNHGFAVDAPLDQEVVTDFGRVRVSHVCLNDDVVEGLQCLDVPAFSVQYHPEAAAGPHDSAYLFDRFAAAMAGGN